MKYFLSVVLFLVSFSSFTQTLLKQTQAFGMDVPAVVIIDNGQKILVGSYDTKLYLINATSGATEKEIPEHKGFVLSLAYNAKTNTVASAGWDQRIILWDAATMTKKLEIAAHNDRITALSFSPDGSRLVSGSEDKTICVWDVMTGGEIFKITDHLDAVTTVTYSKDGNSIASGGWDKIVMLHSAIDGKLINTYKGHRSSINSVDFSYAGDMLVSGSDDNSISIWRTDSAKSIAKFDFFKLPVTKVSFFPGDKYIFCADGSGELKIYNVSNRSLLTQKTIHSGGVKDMYINSALGLMATSGSEKVVKLWNINEYLYFDCVKEKTKSLQEMAKPKGEFETSEMYERRMKEYDIKKSALVSECTKEADAIRKAKQEELDKKTLGTYSYVYFPIQSLGAYDADKQEYPFYFNGQAGMIKLSIDDAKSLKSNMDKAKVKAIKRVVNGNTEYINTEFIHPVTGKSIAFGRHVSATEDPILGKFLQSNH
ncbi:MAG: hypothetical protein A2W93_05300 [Bacteroidetes bacterium GWF2_43_63]|nr:MAG: hypothetical protein A2W94_11850 [Bacteroidetes bacterium GWE2_42_42]OFY56290.1 MAG: hypothetical protein A2W93_05300 [Bacteroidetes bacterium GWF2_43_63]HBG71970.1 hypothetical protein [Bacteroidales bacterium]HCB61871.1 hypothetical protein [Bacteroidales bacterium]HCY23893.1 hypothetical protein [Bacteroidales bacterium]